MAVPEKTTVPVYRGDSVGLLVKVWNDQAKTDPTDLTGTEVRAQVRLEPDAPSVIAEFGVVVTGNEIAMNLLPDQSALLPASSVFDVQVVFDPPTGNDVQTVLRGALNTSPDVTRTED